MGDRVALVLGASRGIGAATVRRLADEGTTVVAAARSADALDALAADVGERCVSAVCDAADPAAVQALVDGIVRDHGRLDQAVNAAAGNQRPTPLADTDVDGFAAVVALNVTGLFAALRAEAAAMRAGGGGAIVNVASTAGLRAVGGLAAYVASKHALVGLTKVAALDHAGDGVRVNAVAPGPIDTEQLSGLPDDVRERIAGTVPQHRLGRPEEVAELIAWLSSDAAGFATGSVVTLDGGRLAGGA